MTAVGLVLGAGGVVGGAFHAGVLAGLADATGWDPRSAEVIVGTSAGALSGAVLRAGLSADDQYARTTGSPLSAEGQLIVGRLRAASGTNPFRRTVPMRPVPASPRLAVTALLPPWALRPGAALAGLLPQGTISTSSIGDQVRDLYNGTRWPARPLWITALRLRDGARTVLGRDERPRPDVGTAVEASAAIPGFFAPVRIDGDAYVDGGAHSPTNADLLADRELDVVVVVSTMSAEWSALRPTPTLGGRVLAGWALERELRAIRARGTPVLVFQPTASDLPLLGHNAMDGTRVKDIAAAARESACRRIDHPSAADLVDLLAGRGASKP